MILGVHSTLAAFAVAIVPALSGRSGTAGAQSTQQLVPVQRYGWEDPGGPGGSATQAQRRLDGGMLSRIADLAEGPDGALYVLDPALFKVVVFNRNGSLRRVIGNGRGAGPGEFIRPNSFTLSESGELFVLDVGQSRVAVFDTAGRLKRTMTIAGSLMQTIRATRDRLYIARYPLGGSTPIVSVYDHAGTLIEKVFKPSAEDLSYGRTGSGYRMVLMRDGRIVLAHPNPGTWSPLAAPDSVLGLALVAHNPVLPMAGGSAVVAPAALRGFGEMADRNLLVLFDLRSKASIEHPDTTRASMHLAIMRGDGTLLETILTGDVAPPLLVARDGKEFYLTVSDPFPQVVRYRLGGR